MSVFGTLSVSLAVSITFTFHLHHMTITWPRLHRHAAAEHLQVLGELKRWRQPRAKRASKSPASSPRVREGGEGGEDRWTRRRKGIGGGGCAEWRSFW